MTYKHYNKLEQQMRKSSEEIQERILARGDSFATKDSEGNLVMRGRVNGKIVDKIFKTAAELKLEWERDYPETEEDRKEIEWMKKVIAESNNE